MARTTTTTRKAGKPSTARKARAPLTPAQKAAATKRRMGLDFSAIAQKALRTRTKNARAAKRAARA